MPASTLPHTTVENWWAAQRLLGQVLHPRFMRALFGMDELAESFDDAALGPDFDLKPIRKAVADLIESLAKR
jgi:hypothetical protein